MSDDEQAIRDLVETWMVATKAGDAATVLALMSDDVVFMVPGAEPFGKEAFAAALKGLDAMTIEGRSDIRELKVLGDHAWLHNHIDMTATAADGKTIRRSGYTLTILRKEADGRWRLARDANLLTTQD
ncbi:SgcJ/EcaC family oxidoreductase [Bosea sp. LjRoot90]|uniref:YybH family protein n=1 Tax=Bosea sp. LjRoot90 TaxID=3342342 RepID=UPI003ED1377B